MASKKKGKTLIYKYLSSLKVQVKSSIKKQFQQ